MAQPSVLERLTIRQRLVLLLLPALAVLVGLSAWTAYSSVLRFTAVAYDRALYDTALTLATQIGADNGRPALHLSDDERRMLEVDPQDDVYFEVFAGGERLGGTANLPDPPAEPAPSESGYFYDGKLADSPIRLVEHVFGAAGDERFVVRVAETLRKRTRLAREATLSIVPVQIAFLGAIVLVVWLGIGWGLRPLAALRAAIGRRDPADLQPLSLRGLPAELRGQAEAINDLMARLSVVLETERRFLADATHQLRTPITVLRTQTELALRARDFESLRGNIGQMQSVCERLTRLANQLLNLSRAEAGLPAGGALQSVDLAAVAEEVLARYEPLAHAKQQTLRLGRDEHPIELRGDPLMLAEMIANLVDNAIRYSRSGAKIEVDTRSDGRRARLTVRDDGPGLSADERSRVLDRFYRGVAATEPGSGLGLAIVREIARAHDGALRLDSAHVDGTGLVATVELPQSRERASPPLGEDVAATAGR
jgi:two-component system, OmpR family, sensor histidine kinase TctE